MKYDILRNCMKSMVFAIGTVDEKSGAITYENVQLVDGATSEEILEACSNATGVSMFVDTLVERENCSVALTELKEVFENHDQLDVWEGNVYYDEQPKLYNGKMQYKVGLSKFMRNGISGASLVSALVGSITS